MFCATTSTDLTCTSDHRALGSCNIVSHPSALPRAYRYFISSKQGGSDALMDYCPYQKEYSMTNCTTDAGALLGNAYGVNARCLNAPSGFKYEDRIFGIQKALCADIQCGASTYAVKVAGATTYTACTPGSTIALSTPSSKLTSGSITCPAYAAVCTGTVDAAPYARH